jgi:FKBP-type peptidyl-prolyl cis-trans isomerase FkpA
MNTHMFGKARLAAAILTVALALGAAACGDSPLDPSNYGVEVIDLRTGNGTEVRVGRGVSVFYTLWLHDPTQPESKGELIETNVGGSPYSALIGYGYVIAGWDVGLPGMKVGGLRRLIVPPQAAYGSSGNGKIPPNSTLVFEIELLGVY